MDIPFSRYTEKLPEEFSVRHKITETTEKRNFHLHRQMEIIFALSGNLKCKFETGEIDIPRNGLILFNQMDLHYIYPEDGSGYNRCSQRKSGDLNRPTGKEIQCTCLPL